MCFELETDRDYDGNSPTRIFYAVGSERSYTVIVWDNHTVTCGYGNNADTECGNFQDDSVLNAMRLCQEIEDDTTDRVRGLVMSRYPAETDAESPSPKDRDKADHGDSVASKVE